MDGVTSTRYSLSKAKEILKDIIQKDNSSEAIPKYDAFEVEDIKLRKNYVFVKRGETVGLYDTSRKAGKELLCLFEPRPEHRQEPDLPCLMEKDPDPFGSNASFFPFEAKNAQEYYTLMYRKALNMVDDVCFMHYVNPETFEPICE